MTRLGHATLWTSVASAFLISWGTIWIAIDSPPPNEAISDVPVSHVGKMIGAAGFVLAPVAISFAAVSLTRRFRSRREK